MTTGTRPQAALTLAVVAMAGLVLATSSAEATVIFSEDFSGTSADLNNTAPDVRPGSETWVASPRFNQDGSIDQGAGSATLAFTPVSGNLYQLDASLAGVYGDGDWFALGFASGQSTGSSSSDRFITGNVMGTAWMLLKGDSTSSQNSAFLGIGTGSNGGTTSNVAWSAWTHENPGGDMDLRIVLDTTGGAGTWTATWLARRPADAGYTVVRPETLMLTETMNSVGLALSNVGVFGTIESFSLQIVPEPATMSLLALGGLALLRRRRRS